MVIWPHLVTDGGTLGGRKEGLEADLDGVDGAEPGCVIVLLVAKPWDR